MTKNNERNKVGLAKSNFIIISIHLLVGFIFWASYKWDWVSIDPLKKWVSGYFFVAPFVIVGWFFRSLRTLKFYLIWIVIGILQCVVYYTVKDMAEFSFSNGAAFSSLKALLPALIMFQVLRFVFFRLRGLELIITTHRRTTMWEEEDKRDTTWIEVLFSLILITVILYFSS